MTSPQLLRPIERRAAILERALHPDAASSDPVGDLVGLAGGRRPPLEAAVSVLIARLHRRSNDFDATRALGFVSAALSRIGWEMPSPPARRHWTGRRR